MASSTRSAREIPAIVWFRDDLRLSDNPALSEAAASGAPLVALYVLDDAAMGEWRLGAASRWWLHYSLASLEADLAARGVPLVLRRGSSELALFSLLGETKAQSVYWNRLYEPWAVRRDGEIKARLGAEGVKARSFNASLLFEPASLRTAQGEPYRVFTPFWRACLAQPSPEPPLPAPARLRGAPAPASESLEDWGLLPTKPDWAGGLREAWKPGESEAKAKLSDFARKRAAKYGKTRDALGEDGVSRLSPHLHFGEVSPREIWWAVKSEAGSAADAYLRQLGWREFSRHLLFANPQLPENPLDKSFARFPWRKDSAGLSAWRKGRTGYPLVDAGMRELWRTGYMHNRARLVAASFLIKHLLIDWREGEAWFWDTLVDADLANNAASWQWIAGCGADAAPYFRVFNPTLQGEKLDPAGAYVRRFVPELAKLDAKWIHRPWAAPATVLESAGVRLGETYPFPIVDHASARARALAAYAER
ncbi:cryptochrome/photolyase family protein [Methylocystis bryophila]|uniref:Deoxyribodipyrimidine photo-lyase n=1 Tax=Methylocystis bryophila TaxID=655015 RepID=A0A1W6MS41_9HYPH|nr:deoxyribodipyrimidine photo-lyase [Methylocystis bryophila]ARN80418.1 deoxyribodipyrimidine photolyase [Methylocystis bryophila]BDV40424.1 deoxyribodipyrimidine photo-lyase [Methylocystis bryophila]